MLGVAALAVIVVVVLAVQLISGLGSDDPDPTGAPTQPSPTAEPTDEPTQEPTDNPTSDGGTIVSGDVVDVDVPAQGTVTFTFAVDEPGVYWVDTFSEEDVDPVVEVTAANGTRWRDDDGTVESSNSYDASLTMVLAAGEHEVVVEDLRHSGTTFELHAGGEPAPAIDAGEQEFSVDEGGTWAGQLDVGAGQTLTVDVYDTDGDAIAGIGLVDGAYEENDDRNSDAPDTGGNLDPYLSVESTEDGAAIVLIWGYDDEAVSGTVSVTVE
ncbi:PT domain-containing protein [Ruania rhizosphaerae]|uniref:PT domain-containing protein n=1 Tax=Ruania rhizosphaerae TaxID=1840413 RepID=UPI001F26C437|nr:PT domain-containing protein [Ruania rhizosphaerae]